MAKKKAEGKKSHKKDYLFDEIKNEAQKGDLVEGMIFRPMILMASFIVFVGAMFLFLLGNMKWGGSLIIFGFVLNLYSIYQSLEDKPSVYRTMNLSFKLVLFLSEVIAFNWLLAVV